MLGVGPLLLVVALSLVFAGFYFWARRQGLVTESAPSEGRPAAGRVSLLTEAVAYIGAILVLAGGGAAIGQRWDDIPGWGHVAILAGAAGFFLVLGLLLHGVHDAAVQRLVGVVWFLSVCGLAAAVAVGAAELYDASAEVTVLTVGMTTTLYAGALWVVRKRALQHVAMFGGLVVVIVGAILTLAPDPAPSLGFALALWAFGLGWALLAWRRLVEPLWVGAPLGVLLALLAPSFGVSDHGWLYAIGILTAGAAMALSVPFRNTPLLGLGTVATFAYVTSMVVRYFSDSLGVPATLAITGFVVLVLATVSARLVRTARPQKPEPPKSKEPPPHGVASPR